MSKQRVRQFTLLQSGSRCRPWPSAHRVVDPKPCRSTRMKRYAQKLVLNMFSTGPWVIGATS